MNPKSIVLLFRFSNALTILALFFAFTNVSDVHACRCGGTVNKYTFISPESLPANANGVVVEFRLSYEDILWSRDNDVILNFLTRKRRPSDFVVKDLSKNKRIRSRLVKLNAKELTPQYSKKRYFLFTKRFYKRCLNDHMSEVKSRSRKCKKMRKILSKHPNDWISKLLKQRILKEVTKKVQKTYGLYRVEPVRKFKNNRKYRVEPTSERKNFIEVYIDSDAVELEYLEDIRMNFDQAIQYRYMENRGRLGRCSQYSPTVVKPIEYELPKDLKPASKYLIMSLMLRHSSGTGSSKNYFKPWSHRSSACSNGYGYNRAAVSTSLKFDCTARTTFTKGNKELYTEVKAIFGMPEIEDRFYVTQAHPFTVGPKQFEACLATEEIPRKPMPITGTKVRTSIDVAQVEQENRLDNQTVKRYKQNESQAENPNKVHVNKNIKLELPLPGSFSDQSEKLDNESSCVQSGKPQSIGFYLLFLLALLRIVLKSLPEAFYGQVDQ